MGRIRMEPTEILSATAHRAWPPPTRSYVQRQSWNDFLFCHWRVPVAAVRAAVPQPLELDLHDGVAWVGVIPFHMSGVSLRGVPDVPGLSAFPELNVRTYVRVGDAVGVYFLSLDAHSTLAVRAARACYGLPYHRANMTWTREGDAIVYRSERAGARYEARYSWGGPVRYAKPGTLEHWLTERYALFVVDAAGAVWRADVHHAPWPLQDASVEITANTMAQSHGLVLPDEAPHVLYSPGVDVVAWTPERVPTSAR